MTNVSQRMIFEIGLLEHLLLECILFEMENLCKNEKGNNNKESSGTILNLRLLNKKKLLHIKKYFFLNCIS